MLFLPFPLLFIFIGAAGFYNVVFRMRPKPRIWHASNPIAGRRFVAALLIVVGLGLFTAFLLGPVRRAIATRSWRTQECKIWLFPGDLLIVRGG
jgi:multisubunit Na+/H+ antiporter MnhB subunit